MLTKYSSLSDIDLIHNLTDKRNASPIIEELCVRIEQFVKDFSRIPNTNHRVECPVCEAILIADFDDANNMFTLKEHQT